MEGYNLVAKTKVKLHLGCGTNIVKDWVNVDNNFDNNIDLKKLDLNWDLAEPLPYKKNSVDMVFHEHFIEHLPKQEGYEFLTECYRVLKPGGAIRIGWPDLTKMLRAYLVRDKKFFNYIAPRINNGMRFHTWDEMLSDFIFSWEHQYAYTRKYLKRVLEDVGFKNVKYKSYMQSDYGFDIDVRNDPATTYIEAQK